MNYLTRAVMLFLLVLLPLGVSAQNRSNNVVLSAGQTVNGNYFGTGADVRVDGTVNGDAYVAGGTVTINGRVNGDLLVAGGTVTIRGPVTQDIRVAGGTVTLAGTVGRNVTVAGGTVVIERDANISGSVVAGVGTMTLASGTQIAGNLSYMSSDVAVIEKGARVKGETDYHATSPRQDKQRTQRNAITGFLWGKIISLVAMYIIGLLFITFLPRFTTRVVDIVKRDSWKSIGLGMVILLVTPLIVIFLMATLIGIPFALATLFGYIMILYIGKIFVAMFLGQWATRSLKRDVSPAWTLFAGLLLHMIITLIPVLGWIAGLFVMLWGTGALTLGKREAYLALRKKDLL